MPCSEPYLARVLLVLALLLSQTPQHRLFQQPNLPSSQFAFFEAFPVSGAGTSGACSTTAPTGAKGETLTFTRTGNATCAKQGPATTGILPGDLVALADNIPRVSYVGTLLTFLRESTSQNDAKRSEALDNAYWLKTQAGVVAPVVTADQGLAPDGTMTADRLVVPACPAAGNLSVVYLTTIAAAAKSTGSIFCESNTASSQSISICNYGGPGVATLCVPITCPVGSYSRTAATSPGSAGTGLIIGCDNESYTGSSNTGAADVLVWGVQFEPGDHMTGYMPTGAAGSSRGAESALTYTLASGIGPDFSIGVSAAYTATTIGTATALQLGTAATDLARVGRNTNTAASLLINAATTTPAVSAMGTTIHRGSLNDNAGTRTAWWDGASIAAPASSMVAATAAVTFGALDAYTGRACADPVPVRCD